MNLDGSLLYTEPLFSVPTITAEKAFIKAHVRHFEELSSIAVWGSDALLLVEDALQYFETIDLRSGATRDHMVDPPPSGRRVEYVIDSGNDNCLTR